MCAHEKARCRNTRQYSVAGALSRSVAAWWAHAIAQQMWRCAPMLARPPQAARRRLRTIAVHESCANRSCGANDSRSQYKAFEQDARSGCSRSTHIAPALRPRCGRVRPRAERLPARSGQRDQEGPLLEPYSSYPSRASRGTLVRPVQEIKKNPKYARPWPTTPACDRAERT